MKTYLLRISSQHARAISAAADLYSSVAMGQTREIGSVFEGKNGNSKSCGCLQRERTSAAKTTHGLGKNSLFYVWFKMKSRCHNPADKSYSNYGG